MRLLFVTNLYPPFEMGGYEQLCLEAAEGLRAKGHQVYILTSSYRSSEVQAQEDHIYRNLHLQADFFHYKPLDFFIRRPKNEQQNRRMLEKVFSEIDPDLTVIWGMWNLSHSIPYWLERRTPHKVAYFISSYWPVDPDIHINYWSNPAGRRLTSFLKYFVNKVAQRQLRREKYPPKLMFNNTRCCSYFVRDTLIEANMLPNQSGVIHLGVDTSRFVGLVRQEPSRLYMPLRLLYFGGLLRHKGVHTIIEALALLNDRKYLSRVKLTILGDGHPDYLQYLQELAIELKVSSSIDFRVRVSSDEVPQILIDHDVFVFSSIWAEPFARTVLEAMAAGLLVIGTEVGGQLEILKDGKNGLTFPAEDSRLLANQIERVVDSPDDMLRLAKEGQKLVLNSFTNEIMLDAMENWLFSN